LDPSSSPFPVPHPRILAKSPNIPNTLGAESLVLRPGQHTREILTELGLDGGQLDEMAREGAIGIVRARL
jgi:alpha-methylacyl-CoA racemase